MIEKDKIEEKSHSKDDKGISEEDPAALVDEYIENLSDICDRFMATIKDMAATIDGRDALCEDIVSILKVDPSKINIPQKEKEEE